MYHVKRNILRVSYMTKTRRKAIMKRFIFKKNVSSKELLKMNKSIKKLRNFATGFLKKKGGNTTTI